MIKNIIYDPKTKRYRYKGENKPGEPITGSFVSRKKVIKLHREHLVLLQEQFINRLSDVKNGKIGTFGDLAKNLKDIHVTNAVIAANGIDKLTPQMLGAIGAELKRHYYQGIRTDGERFGLKHLLKEMIDNPDYSTARLRNRLRMYVNSGEISANIVRKFQAKDSGNTQAKRKLGLTDFHCPSCVRYSRFGWIRLEDVILPKTMCECGTNCLCSIEYR